MVKKRSKSVRSVPIHFQSENWKPVKGGFWGGRDIEDTIDLNDLPFADAYREIDVSVSKPKKG